MGIAEAVRGWVEAQFPKQCRTCGTLYARAAWDSLLHKGNQVDSVETLELRDCVCGSTLAAVVSVADPEAKFTELTFDGAL